MKLPERILRRLRKDRPMTAVTLRMPVDVVDDLKDVAPMLGFSGYQPLMRFYVGSGLRRDLERLEDSGVQALVENLRQRGVADSVLAEAMAATGSAKP
jgi:hypothetical protein